MLQTKEIVFAPSTGLDRVGRVFFLNGNVYRGLYASHAAFYKRLLLGPLWQELVAIGLIETEISDLRVEGFETVLRHRKIPTLTNPYEWTNAMLKDAALLTCDIQSCLVESGLTLKDAHPWNIFFDRGRPIFVDLGSVCEGTERKHRFFLQQFRETFLFLLLLRRGIFAPYAQAMLETNNGIPGAGFFKILYLQLPFSQWFYHRWMCRKVSKLLSVSPKRGLKTLREQITVIEENVGSKEKWENLLKEPQKDSVERRRCDAFTEILNEYNPRTVMEIGVGTGWRSVLAEKSGATVIAVDTNEEPINNLYQLAKAGNLRILPVLLDISDATQVCGRTAPSTAPERLRCEMVVMFGLISRLEREYNLPIDQIASYIHAFCERWGVVEFKGYPEEGMCRRRMEEQQSCYSLTDFQSTFRQYFQEVLVIRQIGDDRWLLLCRR